MQFTFFLFFGYIGVSLLSPVMHNLWIWRVSLLLCELTPLSGTCNAKIVSSISLNLTGFSFQGTGNANFYFATGLAYTCLQVTKYSYHMVFPLFVIIPTIPLLVAFVANNSFF
jgi:phosphatidylinositol glycan class U